MDFPKTPILDSFNRTNEGPPPSSSWSSITFISGIKVVSNQLAGDGSGVNGGVWNTPYTDWQECYATIATLPGSSEGVSVIARAQQEGSGLTIDGYSVNYFQDTPPVIRVRRIDNGVASNLATFTVTLSAGDKIGIRLIGDQIIGFYDSGSGWAEAARTTDSTYTGSGKLGALITNTTGRLDDFGGGIYRRPHIIHTGM